jgi:hypothetical protein
MKLHLNYIRKILVISFFLLGLIVPLSLDSVSAFDTLLRTEAAKVKDVEIRGTFTLLVYGGTYLDNIETIAFLDYENDEYVFEPYSPPFSYSIHKGLTAKDALGEADSFISTHSSFYRAQLNRILDDTGKTIAYELRPLYMPLTYGLSDVLDVRYWLKDKKVDIIIRLHPAIKDPRIQNGDGSDTNK